MPKNNGDRFDLKMTAKINDVVICEGNYTSCKKKIKKWCFVVIKKVLKRKKPTENSRFLK